MPADQTAHSPSDGPTTAEDPRQRYPATAHLDESARHRVLSAARRRHVLTVAAARPVPVTLDALAAAVVSREDEAAPDDADARERVALSLHHVHLPLLDEYGVIEYDVAERRIVA